MANRQAANDGLTIWIVSSFFLIVGSAFAFGWPGIPIAAGISGLCALLAGTVIQGTAVVADKLEWLAATADHPADGDVSTTFTVEPGQGQGGVSGSAAGSGHPPMPRPPGGFPRAV